MDKMQRHLVEMNLKPGRDTVWTQHPPTEDMVAMEMIRNPSLATTEIAVRLTMMRPLIHSHSRLLRPTIDVKNLQKGIKNLKKPGFNPKNKKP